MFSYICHFIFAIVIATSYDTATLVFVNPNMPFLSSPESLIFGLEMLLAYVAIVSGWVGYSRSMIKWPHSNTRAGSLRFSLDIAILFCYFSLITSASPQNVFREYFLEWLVALFALFTLWDILKISEHRERNQLQRNRSLSISFVKTVLFFVLFILIFFTEPHISEWSSQTNGMDNIVYIIVLVIVILILLFYRYVKWSMRMASRTKT